MDRLTLKIEYSDFLNDDITNYLNSINGIKSSKVDNDNNEIYVEYDSSVISLNLLKMEIILYLDIEKIPSIISFNKHINNNIKKAVITIEDLCCEYCLKGMIDELLTMDGIESAYTDFNYINKNNVNIYLTYNEKLINKDEILEISNKFNN